MNEEAEATAEVKTETAPTAEQSPPKTYSEAEVEAITKSFKSVVDETLSEAEKLSKMTKEQKAEYSEQKRAEDLTKREAEITKRELMATAKETLSEKGLPLELSEILDFSNADNCAKSIEKVGAAFTAAVEKAVDSRIKGGAPLKGENSPIDGVEAHFYSQNPELRRK